MDHGENGLQCIELLRKVGGGRQFSDVEEVTQFLHYCSGEVHVIGPDAHLRQPSCSHTLAVCLRQISISVILVNYNYNCNLKNQNNYNYNNN